MASLLKRLFGRKASPGPVDHNVSGKVAVTARLNARVLPLDRGQIFADPLETMLSHEGLGVLVGEGTLMAENGQGVAKADLEVALRDTDEITISRLITLLNSLGAPKGSEILLGNQSIPFGTLEGLAVYLNGKHLPAEVYRTSDVNQTIAALNKAVDGLGAMRGHWQGQVETALYFYGMGFDAMRAALAEVLAQDPLCQGCRIERIA